MNPKEAATRKHHIDGPARLNSSHCGNNHIAADGKKQADFEKNKIVNLKKGSYMNQELAVRKEDQSQELSIIEQVVMQGDLSKLDPTQRVIYYRKVCESLGLNPFTRPFDYIMLNGKLTLYAKKDATEQLRKSNGISIEKLESKIVDDLYIVTARAKTRDGRTDEATGAVTIGHLKGDAKANAIMKAETKAKRRVTLSISGMGWTDESEIDTIPNAKTVQIDLSTGEIIDPSLSQKEEKKIPISRMTVEQAEDLRNTLDECDEKYREWVYNYLRKEYKTDDLTHLPLQIYERMKSAAVKNMQQNHEKQRIESIVSEPELIALEMQ